MFICLTYLQTLDEHEGRPGSHLPWYGEMCRSTGFTERWRWECGSYSEGDVDRMQRTGWRSDTILFI